MIYRCCNLLRREATRQSPLNGIDFLEVIDNAAPVDADRQRFLHIHLLSDPAPETYTTDQIVVEGPDGPMDIVTVQNGLPPQANILVVELLASGDFSIYTLRIRRSAIDDRPPVELDPQLAVIEFSFKVECPSDFDCLHPCDCTDDSRSVPEIDYFARDISSFRNMLLGRLAIVQPEAPPPHIADMRMTLVDELAVMADQIAQSQDAVHTDAYLAHTRSRISARRLALAVDYQLDEGQNARSFVHLEIIADILPVGPLFEPVIPVGTPFATRISNENITLSSAAALQNAAMVFEARLPTESLFSAHNELPFYSWSDQRCCLPAGSTSATLEGHFPDLAVGQFLAFEELVGARTGNSADRDRSNRPVVQLAEVTAFAEGVPLIDSVTGIQITEIHWQASDELERSLCLTAETDEAFGRLYLPQVSVARGNIVLADHGRTVASEQLGEIPPSGRSWAPGRGPMAMADDGARPDTCQDMLCERPDTEWMSPRFNPILERAPLTFAVAADEQTAARDLLAAEGIGQPQISVIGTLNGNIRDYHAERDLLGSGPDTPAFVPEVEHGGYAKLRYGDDINGLRPNEGTSFVARYRVGLGPIGNIGEDTLFHVLGPAGIIGVRNMTPGQGGRAPETVDTMRRRAPFAYRRQDRAVTRDDHDIVAARFRPPEGPIQGSVTDIMHTGSWYTSKIVADRPGGLAVDTDFRHALRNHVEPYRMAGRDLEVDGPLMVALEIDMQVCVCSDHLRGKVKQALLEHFSNRRLPDGTLGAFHPDRMNFGQSVYLSPLIALAQSIEGVTAVRTKIFRRFNDPTSSGLLNGMINFGRREIARLDNDPSHADRGVLRLNMVGGR